jgi:hypothetical protein
MSPQVILLLKSSDRVMHDLEQLQQLQQTSSTQQRQQQRQQQQQQQQQPLQQDLIQHQRQDHQANSLAPVPQLVLRRWQELLPEREFRCFAAGHALVAISQRDPSQHFPQLGLSGDVEAIRKQLLAWHREKISSSFPLDSCECVMIIGQIHVSVS